MAIKIVDMDSILSIQDVDLKKIDLARSIKSDAVYQEYNKVMSVLTKLKANEARIDSILKSDFEKADKIIEQIDAYNKELENFKDEADSLINDEMVDIESLEDLIKDIHDEDGKLKNLNANLSTIKVNVAKAEASNMKTEEEIAKIVSFVKAKKLVESYHKLQEDYKKDLKKLTEELDELKAKMNKSDLDVYEKTKTQVKTLPIVLKFSKEDGICPSCRMMISARVKNDLVNKGDVVTCEECHRILFLGE